MGGLYAGDALTPGQVYDKPFAQAYAELAAMPVPGLLAQGVGGSDATSVEVQRAPGSISWGFHLGGQTALTFTARLSAEGSARTRVRIDYAPGVHVSPELKRLASTRLMSDFAEIAMAEQVDAELEDRTADKAEMLSALARHAADHPELVREYGQAVGGIFKEIGNQAAANAGAGGPSVQEPIPHRAMEAATRPSVILPTS